MPLVKASNVTVIPGVEGVEGVAASLVCTPLAPPTRDTPPDEDDPVPAPPATSGAVDEGVTPTPGQRIMLRTLQPDGSYVTSEALAPQPAGYVCRWQIVVLNPGASHGFPTSYVLVCQN